MSLSNHEGALTVRQNEDLWKRLQNLHFDEPGAVRPFSARLADEQGWTADYSGRVIEEYRRFVFLTAAAGHVVCPSEDVDRAWHQHLTFTRSYWNDLCRDVLTRPLHHDPTRGGSAEAHKHWDRYRQTLASYRRIFAEEPPRDIWPPGYERFDARSQPRQVDLRDHWVIRKPTWWPRTRRMAGVTAAATLPPVAAVGLGPFDLVGPEFLVFFGALYVIALVLGIMLRYRHRHAETASNDPDLTPAEAACLAFGRPASVNATVAGMLRDGSLTSHAPKSRFFGLTNGKTVTFQAGEHAPDGNDRLALLIYRATQENPQTLVSLQTALRTETEEISSDLMARGYLVDDERAGPARWLPVCLMSVVVIAGLFKSAIGIMRERPIALLVVGCGIALVTLAVFATRPRRTIPGDRMLASLQSRYAAEKSQMATTVSVAMCAALFGATTLTGGGLDDLKKAWMSNATAHGGGGCSGSGCGGAGCGGGCGGGGCGGGCGGCGGG